MALNAANNARPLTLFQRRTPGGRTPPGLKAAVREHFRLAATVLVFVAERSCPNPGCPPLETIIDFWPEDGACRRFRVFKPMAEVGKADFPPWWMRNAMQADEFDNQCC
ncbi:MAG: hypothetical protein AB7E55_33110 [Pigmentiphaga sp.]